MDQKDKVLYRGRVMSFTDANRKRHSSFKGKQYRIYPFGRLSLMHKAAKVQIETLGYVMLDSRNFVTADEYRARCLGEMHNRLTECLERPFNRGSHASKRDKAMSRERVWQCWQGKGWKTLEYKKKEAEHALANNLQGRDAYVREFMRLIKLLRPSK